MVSIDNLKFKYQSLPDNKKAVVKMGIILGGILLLFIIIVIIVSIVMGNKKSYEQFENIVLRASERYVTDNPTVIDQSTVYGTTEITIDTLVTNNYMKEVSKYLGEDRSCTGKVLVYRNMKDLKYIPKIKCGTDYSDVSISEKIILNEEVVSENGGLYAEDGGYVFRGQHVNNNVVYSGQNWKIISIDKVGNIKMIQADRINDYVEWDDRYNAAFYYNSGFNEFQGKAGTESSRIKDYINQAYNGSALTDEAKKIIVPTEYCIGKRGETDKSKDGSTECALKTELSPAGLLSVNEFLHASLDEKCIDATSRECGNYNYFTDIAGSYWTATASNKNTADVYYINNVLYISKASNAYPLRLVVVVNGLVNYKSGSGTTQDPYILD